MCFERKRLVLEADVAVLKAEKLCSYYIKREAIKLALRSIRYILGSIEGFQIKSRCIPYPEM